MESIIEDIEAVELAQQMCIHNYEWFRHIHPIEFLNQIWRKKDELDLWATPNLDFFSARFDRVCFYSILTIIIGRNRTGWRQNCYISEI